MVTQEAGFRIQSPSPLGDLLPLSTCKEIIPHHKLLELANIWQSSMLYRP
jgi:hypothetical protein